MDGLPIQPLAASMAGADVAAQRQLNALAAKRADRLRSERQVDPPTRVDPVDDEPDHQRRRRSRREPPKRPPDADGDHVDLTA